MNPWEEIGLETYEKHMSGVMQLQALDEITRRQLEDFDVKTAMILGIAGGNGLSAGLEDKYEKIYGVDVNAEYLAKCAVRFPELRGVLELMRADAAKDALPKAELVIANLFIEYIGCEAFAKIIGGARYVSCVVQKDVGDGFISVSPYAAEFERLSGIHREISDAELIDVMKNAGYTLTGRCERKLPHGKLLIRLDFAE